MGFDTVVRLRRVHRQPGASKYKESLIRLRDGAATELHARFLAQHSLSASDVPLVMMTPSFVKPFVPSSAYGRMGDPATSAG